MSFSKTFRIEYTKAEGGKRVPSHGHEETWHLTELYCPSCGKRGLWAAAVGDYYVGEQHICVECKATFNLPGEPHIINTTDETRFMDEADVQRLWKLKS